MAESEEKVKVELELPKDEVHISEASGPRLESKKSKKKDQNDNPESPVDYSPLEIAKAPLEPPEPKSKAPPTVHQQRVIVFGFILIIAGILLWPIINFMIGLAFAVSGAIVVSFGALVRI